MGRVSCPPYFANCIRSPFRNPGLPPTRPRLRAAFRPALVRPAISARSSWATAPRTCRENMPCGVVVSMGSRRLWKWAPLASSCSMTASRWLTERASRSSRPQRGFRRSGSHVAAGPARGGCGRHRTRAPPAPIHSLQRGAHRAADRCPGLPWRPVHSRSVGRLAHFC
jgi:hypothetical protein